MGEDYVAPSLVQFYLRVALRLIHSRVNSSSIPPAVEIRIHMRCVLAEKISGLGWYVFHSLLVASDYRFVRE
jgi:hypothetical protein